MSRLERVERSMMRRIARRERAEQAAIDAGRAGYGERRLAGQARVGWRHLRRRYADEFVGRVPRHDFVDHEYVGLQRRQSGLCHGTYPDPDGSGSLSCLLPAGHPVHGGLE